MTLTTYMGNSIYLVIKKQQITYDLRLTGKQGNVIMEFQKSINFLDHTPNQLSKFGKRNCVEINDGSRGTYNTDSQTKLQFMWL